MKAMMLKKPAVKKPAMKKFAAGGAVAKKKPVKKYADGGMLPVGSIGGPSTSQPDPATQAMQQQMLRDKAMVSGKKAPPASAPAPSPYMPSAGTGMPIVDSPQQQQRNQQYQMQTRAALTPAVSPERQRIMDMLNAEAAGAQARAAFQQRQKAFATPAPRRRMAKGGVVAKMSTAKGKKK
jgi:hypothetical protein